MIVLQEPSNMLFNFKNFKLVFLLGLLFITSCGLKIGEKPKQENKIEVASVACLNNSIETLKRIFKAEANDAEVAPAFNCLSETVKTFSTSIQGQNKSYFTTEELVYFLNRNIITQGSKIPDSLARELMKIKVSFLGGEKEVLTKNELDQLRLVIDFITPEAVLLNPHMNIIVKKWNPSNLTPEEKEYKFNEAHKALTVFSDKLFSQFSKSPTGYDINSGIDLIKEFLAFNESSSETISHIENYRGIAVAVKKNLIGDTSPIIQSSDWRVVSHALSDTVFLIQRSYYFTSLEASGNTYSQNNSLSRYGLLAQDIATDVYGVLDMQNSKSVTLTQIAETFNEVFKAFELNLELNESIMKDITLIKNAVINNSDESPINSWSKNDFYLLSFKMNTLFREIGIMLSQIDEMDQDSAWKTDYTVFNKAEYNFVQSLERLVPIIDGRYDLQYVSPLLNSLKQAGLIKSDVFIQDYEKYYNTIVSTKKLFTAVDGTSLKSNDLKNLISLLGQGYFHFLEYNNYIKLFDYKNEVFAEKFLNLLPKIKQTLSDALDQNQNGFFSTEDFLNLYTVACTDLKLKSFLSPESLKIVLDALWTNILIDFNHRISGQILPGFNKEALNNLYFYVKLLFDSNYLAQNILKANPSPHQAELISSIHSEMNNTQDPYTLQILKEMEAAFSGPVPLTTQNGLLKILDPQSNVYSYADLQMSNIVRVAARIITLSYSTSISEIFKMDQMQSQLTRPELQFAFDQLKSVLYEKDIVNPLTVDFIGKRFQDANLFVSRSNGDDFLSYLEIHDIAIHMITGSARAVKTHDNIYNHCLTPAALPLNRKTEIYDLCLLETYFLFDDGFEYIPQHLSQKKILGEAQFKEYSYNLLLAAGLIANEKQIVLLDDADNLPHIVQYIEMMYAKYDFNQDGQLTKDEALAAFPTFKNLIKKVVSSMESGSKIKEEQYPGVFIYFLKYGRAPKTVIEKLQFMSFISNEKKWIVNATRWDIGVVFQFIAASSSPAPAPTAP